MDDAYPPAPHPLFAQWLRDAEAHDGIQYAGATCLSTVAPGGVPDGRIVLLHDAGPERFAFFTDARSRKGQALAACAHAALTFYWGPLERQVRVQGAVTAATPEAADRFFAERPRRSRLTAWASPQSRPLSPGSASEALAQRMEAVRERFAERASIPRPPYWKAYAVRPRRVEFWEARARRLHWRLEYTRRSAEQPEHGAARWAKRRLAP